MTRRLRDFRGGLDRRDGADDRQVQGRSDVVERDRRCRVAGDDREARVEPLHEAAEESGNAARDLGFAALAVRKGGAVGRVDDRRVRKQFARRAEHR